MVADVRKLMYDHIVDGFLGVLHQPPGKTDRVSAAAAAEAGARAGDRHARRAHAHERGVVLDLRRENRFGLFYERAALRLIRLGMRGLPCRKPLVLTREPRALLFHDPADLGFGRKIRRAHNKPPVLIEPQTDGPPVRADDGIALHQYHAHPNRRILMSHCPTV